MAGYWQRPEETAKVMTPDGFFKSGDVGIMDERGYTKIVDRKKDMVIVSGFNVYPNEVESVVATHPGVLECAVIGVPDEEWGEAVKAVVVMKPGRSATAQEIVDTARKHLASYMKPRSVEFVDALPKAPTGKILKRELRDPHWQGRSRKV
jgi:long-chain acyl-CoA synthetase